MESGTKQIDISVKGKGVAIYKNEKGEDVTIHSFSSDDYHYALDKAGNKLNGNISFSQYRDFMGIEIKPTTIETSIDNGKAYYIINGAKTEVTIKLKSDGTNSRYQGYDITTGTEILGATFSNSQANQYFNKTDTYSNLQPVKITGKGIATMVIDGAQKNVTISPKTTRYGDGSSNTEYLAYDGSNEIPGSGVSVAAYDLFTNGQKLVGLNFPEFKTDDISGDLGFRNTFIEHTKGLEGKPDYSFAYTLKLQNGMLLQTFDGLKYDLYKVTRRPIEGATPENNDPYTYTHTIDKAGFNKDKAKKYIAQYTKLEDQRSLNGFYGK